MSSATSGNETDWMVGRAERIARNSHIGQTDRAGRPYVSHVARVVKHLKRMFPDATVDELAAAWLHDVLEDCPITSGDLLSLGMSPRVVEIVRAVTRSEAVTYLEWIRGIALRGDVSAIRVKLADNADNSDRERVMVLPDGERLLAERYEPARQILLDGLARLTNATQLNQEKST